MLTVITGWSPAGWRDYAHRFVESFQRFWPASVRCLAYVEDDQKIVQRKGAPTIETRSIWDIPDCRAFVDKYRGDSRANGREVQLGWKENWKKQGYCFKWDAWKFCRQGFIPLAASQEISRGLMCWLDADVLTRQAVPEGFIEALLPESKAVAYLGRHPKHSEIGFQLYRVPEAAPALCMFSNLYRYESVFKLAEWHSAYAFDHAVVESRVPAHNLTPNGSGNVFDQSPLAPYLLHLKGDRKYRRGYLRMKQ